MSIVKVLPAYLGILTDLAIDSYHSSAGISKSGISCFAKSPKLYWYQYLSGKRTDSSSQAMTFGTMFHEYLLEPAIFKNKYVIEPPYLDGRTKEGKNWKLANAQKEIIRRSDHQLLLNLAEAIASHKIAKTLLGMGGLNEVSYYWMDQGLDLLLKCRPDRMLDVNVVVDLKTARTAKPDDFKKDANYWSYHISAALTLDGIEAVTGKRPDEYLFLVVEKEPPFNVCVFRASNEMIEAGRVAYRSILTDFKVCLANNTWPGYPEEIITLNLPEGK